MARMRAVSPVVATALLVLIAVATAVLLYLWVSGTVAATPTQQQNLREEIKIDAVNITQLASGYNVSAYIRNVGQLPVNITELYVIDANTGSVIAVNTTINGGKGLVLNPGQVGLAWVKASLSKGQAIIVKAVTKDGVEAQYVLTVR